MIKGKINWYDSYSGRGSIISEDNVWYRIGCWTQITDQALLVPGTNIKFKLTDSSIHPIVIYLTSNQYIGE